MVHSYTYDVQVRDSLTLADDTSTLTAGIDETEAKETVQEAITEINA